MEPTADRNDRSEAAEARRLLHAAVGARIRDIRLSRDLGQAECARGAGIDTSSLFRIERTGQNLTVETLARLALSLGVPMEELLTGVYPDPGIIERRTRG